MTSLFASGRVVDLILGLVALEAVALAVYRGRTGRGLAVPRFAGFLLSGVFLMLALRAALVDAWWGWIALCLGASLVAHLVDLHQRWTGHNVNPNCQSTVSCAIVRADQAEEA